jgi:hypothetical protein
MNTVARRPVADWLVAPTPFARRLSALAMFLAAAVGSVDPARAQIGARIGAQMGDQTGAQTVAPDTAGTVSADGLRWTPHRPRRTPESFEGMPGEVAAATPGERLASADPDGLRNTPSAGQRAAASVVLDDQLARLRPDEPLPGLPPFAVAGPSRTAPEPVAAGSEPSGRGAVAGPLRAGLNGLSLPSFPPIMPNLVGRRAPQGDIGRPSVAPAGGSLRGDLPEAPRFRSSVPQPAARVAINADGLPSVMARTDGEGGPESIPSPATPRGAQAPALPQSPPAARAAPTPPRMPESAPSRPAAPQLGSASDGVPPGWAEPGFDPQIDDGAHAALVGPEQAMPSDGLWMGGYPSAACDTCDTGECSDEECGFLPCMAPSGRFCAFLRQFGQPYYGWKWYRDLTASVGVTSFQTPADLGLFGNYGTNEYLNWSMPFWNAFGIGWQLGVRGVQSNFQRTTVTLGDIGNYGSSVRDQFFLTTGFFTRAFEGRGLQFGAVWDYLQDDWIDNVDVAQIRAEISYVWNVHEIGFWGAFQYDTVPFSGRQLTGQATTFELFNAFYRLQFGDANEWKVWGGATQNGDGYLGTLVRAPMTRSLALEGTFAYLIPKNSTRYTFDGGSISFTDAAWNISANVVFYPGCRSRRSLASPYRPLFEVADNGTMIRSIEGLGITP